MALPPLLIYDNVECYRRHYERIYCRGHIITFDDIRVYFAPGKFGHAFYESSGWDGHKDKFSPVRAQRMDWIKATLEHRDACLFQGWYHKTRRYDTTRRVAVVYENFVVVVAMAMKRNRRLKANFVTCYQADNSIGKIRQAPHWSYRDCVRRLGGQI